MHWRCLQFKAYGFSRNSGGGLKHRIDMTFFWWKRTDLNIFENMYYVDNFCGHHILFLTMALFKKPKSDWNFVKDTRASK